MSTSRSMCHVDPLNCLTRLVRFDYIARDTHAIDMKVNLSLTRYACSSIILNVSRLIQDRLIHSARVINDEICYHIKDANQIYELCHTRFSLHKRVYSHKTGSRNLLYAVLPVAHSLRSQNYRVHDHRRLAGRGTLHELRTRHLQSQKISSPNRRHPHPN